MGSFIFNPFSTLVVNSIAFIFQCLKEICTNIKMLGEFQIKILALKERNQLFAFGMYGLSSFRAKNIFVYVTGRCPVLMISPSYDGYPKKIAQRIYFNAQFF